jgi:hypothetical protein
VKVVAAAKRRRAASRRRGMVRRGFIAFAKGVRRIRGLD